MATTGKFRTFLRVSQMCFHFRLPTASSLYYSKAVILNHVSFIQPNLTRSLVKNQGTTHVQDFVHPYDRMIFVGKLSPSTTQKLVEDYFSQFGEVEHVYLTASKKRYELRSCAFVRFKEMSSLDKISFDPYHKHVIDARSVVVQKYKATDPEKIQVCDVPVEFDEAHLRDHFSQFGTVEEVQFVSNNPLVSRESYCFIKFTSPSAAVKALALGSHQIGEHVVEVKIYTAKNKNFIRGKVVLEGIPENVAVEDLRDYFSKFGPLAFIDLAYYHSRGKQRGDAFLVFSDDKTVELVAEKNGIHLINGQEVHVKRATSNHVTKGRDLKIFVDRIPATVSEPQVRRYFQSFGNATVLKKWKGEDNLLSYIIMFQMINEVDRVLAHVHTLGGEKLIVKRTGWTAKPQDTQLMDMLSLL